MFRWRTRLLFAEHGVWRTSNFDHLEELDPGPAAFGRFAERYFVDDPNTALIKTRQFTERLSVGIAESAGAPVDQRRGFADVLRLIQMDGAASREALDVLHRLRRYGNVAAHGVLGDRRDAFEAVSSSAIVSGSGGAPPRPGHRS